MIITGHNQLTGPQVENLDPTENSFRRYCPWRGRSLYKQQRWIDDLKVTSCLNHPCSKQKGTNGLRALLEEGNVKVLLLFQSTYFSILFLPPINLVFFLFLIRRSFSINNTAIIWSNLIYVIITHLNESVSLK